MLKLTYSDADLSLEYLAFTLEAMVAQRSIVAVRAGQPMVVQPGYGSFTLPGDLPGIAALRAERAIDLSACDRDWVEITLRGTWLADGTGDTEGILVVELGPALEHQLVTLWQQSLRWVATPCSQRR
jgi:hypothetical protein